MRNPEKDLLKMCRDLEKLGHELRHMLFGPRLDDDVKKHKVFVEAVGAAINLAHSTCCDRYLVSPVGPDPYGSKVMWQVLKPGLPSLNAHGRQERPAVTLYTAFGPTPVPVSLDDLDTALDLSAALNVGRQARLERALEPRRKLA